MSSQRTVVSAAESLDTQPQLFHIFVYLSIFLHSLTKSPYLSGPSPWRYAAYSIKHLTHQSNDN